MKSREDSVNVEYWGETNKDIEFRFTDNFSTLPLDRLESEYKRKRGISVRRTGSGNSRIFIFNKDEAQKSLNKKNV